MAPAIVAPALLPGAVAHDGLVAAVPGDGAVISTAPTKIELTFSGNPRKNFNTLALSRGGEVIVSGSPEIDANVLTLEIPGTAELADGDYVVGYQITSSDGHSTRGSYSFTLDTGAVNGAPAAGENTEEATDASTKDNDLPSWAGPLLAFGSVVVLAGAVVMLFMQLRRSGS